MRFQPRSTLSGVLVLAFATLLSTDLRAQSRLEQTDQANPTPGPTNAPAVPQGPAPFEPGFTTQLFASSRATLLGDAYGLRSFLASYGISVGLQETSEGLSNITGGIRRSADYEGLTIASLGVDTHQAFGWEGGIFNVSALQIHGRNLSAETLLNLNTASGIEATRATRLWELWYQQSFLEARLDLKLGQQSLDQEFIGSAGAGTFINTMMGWPVVPSYDLYAGGPAYPLSSLGIRLRAEPTGAITVLAGVFDDNPPGGSFHDDSQILGGSQSGTAFNLDTGALFIAELQYALNQPAQGDLAAAKEGHGLPGTYKVGAWFDTASFPDQRFDNTGLSLADPNSSGVARQRRGNFSLYGVADQMVWRPDKEQPLSVGLFTRIMEAPGDRNLIDFGVNAGVVIKAPLPGRDNDTFGVGYGLAKVGRNAARLDGDTAYFSQAPYQRRSSESFVEVTYQYQVAPWWQLQPDFQYVFLPGGGIANPNAPTRRISNEAVFGLRTNLTF